MKNIFILSVLILLSLSSCQKVNLPEIGSHKFTYYIETDGIVEITYDDNNGKPHTVEIINEKWHLTFDVEMGQILHIEFFPKIDCKVGYYFAQDGVVMSKEALKYRNAYHGVKGTFKIMELP